MEERAGNGHGIRALVEHLSTQLKDHSTDTWKAIDQVRQECSGHGTLLARIDERTKFQGGWMAFAGILGGAVGGGFAIAAKLLAGF